MPFLKLHSYSVILHCVTSNVYNCFANIAIMIHGDYTIWKAKLNSDIYFYLTKYFVKKKLMETFQTYLN